MDVNLLLVPAVSRECLQVEEMGNSVEQYGHRGRAWRVGFNVKMRAL